MNKLAKAIKLPYHIGWATLSLPNHYVVIQGTNYLPKSVFLWPDSRVAMTQVTPSQRRMRRWRWKKNWISCKYIYQMEVGPTFETPEAKQFWEDCKDSVQAAELYSAFAMCKQAEELKEERLLALGQLREFKAKEREKEGNSRNRKKWEERKYELESTVIPDINTWRVVDAFIPDQYSNCVPIQLSFIHFDNPLRYKELKRLVFNEFQENSPFYASLNYDLDSTISHLAVQSDTGYTHYDVFVAANALSSSFLFPFLFLSLI